MCHVRPGSSRLFVDDISNHRVIIFERAASCPEATIAARKQRGSWIGSTVHGLHHDVRHHVNPSMKLIAGFVYVPIEPLHSIIHIEGAFHVDRGLYRLLKLHHNAFEVVKVVLLVLLYSEKFFAAEVAIYQTLASEPNRKNASCLVNVPLVLLLETTLFCPWAVAKF